MQAALERRPYHLPRFLGHESRDMAFAELASPADTRSISRVYVDVDIEELVETIRGRPGTSNWERQIIEKLIGKYGLGMKIMPRRLTPNRCFEPHNHQQPALDRGWRPEPGPVALVGQARLQSFASRCKRSAHRERKTGPFEAVRIGSAALHNTLAGGSRFVSCSTFANLL